MRGNLLCVAALAGALTVFVAFESKSQPQGPEGEKPSAATVEEARSRFLRGVQLYREGDYVTAMVEFKRAHAIAPNYRVLYNLALTSLRLKDYAASLDYFERYLAEGGSDIGRARQREVKEQIERLNGRVGQLTIVVSAPGAMVLVDDVEVGSSPLAEPVRVSAGRVKIAATLDGYAPASRYVEVAGSDKVNVELRLTPLSPARAPDEPMSTPETPPPAVSDPLPPPVADPVEEEKPRTMPLVWVGVGLTGALAISSGTMGALTLQSRSKRDDELDEFPGDADAIDSAQDELSRRALVTDVLTGATVVVGATTLVLALTSKQRQRAQRKSKRTADVELHVAPNSLTLGGRF